MQGFWPRRYAGHNKLYKQSERLKQQLYHSRTNALILAVFALICPVTTLRLADTKVPRLTRGAIVLVKDVRLAELAISTVFWLDRLAARATVLELRDVIVALIDDRLPV